MDRTSQHRPASAGVTLLELMVVLVILAVTLSLVTPAMRNTLRANEVHTEAARLLAAINLTRSEAISRNTPVSMCPSAMAYTGVADCAGVYTDGWIVFSNPDRDEVVDAGVDVVIAVFDAIAPRLSLTNKSGSKPVAELISYLPDGSSRKNRTLLLCPPAGVKVPSSSVVMNIVGRPRLAANWGECPTV